MWDVLYTIAMKGGEGATYDELQEVTGLSYDRVREIVAGLEDQDILLRTTYPRVVLFHNAELRLNAAEKLVEVHPNRGFPEIREDAVERRERREKRRQENESDSTENDDVDESDQEESKEETSLWMRFGRLEMTGPQLGRALDQDVVDEEHVKVKIDEYPALFGSP